MVVSHFLKNSSKGELIYWWNVFDGIFSGWKKDGLDLVDSLNLTKAEKKKLEKLDKISIHLQGEFKKKKKKWNHMKKEKERREILFLLNYFFQHLIPSHGKHEPNLSRNSDPFPSEDLFVYSFWKPDEISRNKSEKNPYFPALFAAVEHSQVEKARTILATTDVDVNRYVKMFLLLLLKEYLKKRKKKKETKTVFL